MIYNANISTPSQARWRCKKTINRGLITGQGRLPTSIRRVNTNISHHEPTRGTVRGASDVQ